MLPRLLAVIPLFLLALATGASVRAGSPDWPPTLTIVTASPGGTYHAYGAGLAEKPVVVALNKIDTLDDELIAALSAELEDASGAPVVPVSGAAGTGIDWVLDQLLEHIPDKGAAAVPSDDVGEDALDWSPL